MARSINADKIGHLKSMLCVTFCTAIFYSRHVDYMYNLYDKFIYNWNIG